MSFVGNALNNVPIGKVNVVTFTSNGTYTPPDNLRAVTIFASGGGGGGGYATVGGSNTWTVGGGGGAGSWGSRTLAASAITGTIGVTVGLGGSAGVGSSTTSAGAGGNSVVVINSSSHTAGGGGAGSDPTTISSGNYFAPGDAFPGSTSGSWDITGSGTRHSGSFLNNVGSVSVRMGIATAGTGFFGGGGARIVFNATTGGSGTAGANANALSSGGSGGSHRQPTGSGAINGGTGGNGIVIITEYLAEEA